VFGGKLTALRYPEKELVSAPARQVYATPTKPFLVAAEVTRLTSSEIAKGRRGLVQPAVKCRGREYLRIIYGPEYTATENLQRLRGRGLSRKRSLALREFALGIESLERFVRNEPLRRVHEAVFGVLALESEPVDPRL